MARQIEKHSLVAAAFGVALIWIGGMYLPAVWKSLDVFSAVVLFSVPNGLFLVVGVIAAALARNGLVRYRLAYMLIFAPAIHLGACGVPAPWHHVFLIAPSAVIVLAGILELRY